MDDADPHDSDVIDLVVNLCAQIGMMMEDISPRALDASREGLEQRVADIVRVAQVIVTIADAAQTLLRQ